MLLTHVVSPQEEGMTLQHVLRSVMGLSSRQTRIAKQQGAVSVDAAPFFSNQPLSAGMVIRVSLPDYGKDAPQPAPALPAPQVLYEDEALIAVMKPALLQCHPSPSAPGGSDTLEARVSAYLCAPAHPVHRLDAETTGVVLFAKVPFAQAHLQKQMQEGTFTKTYQAWVCGVPQPSCGVIDAPIARTTPDSFTRAVRADGQSAVSRYETLRTVSLPCGESLSLVRLSPVTGRTHQLRVHMAHIGHPLLGDTRYASEASRLVSRRCAVAYHQLCAVSLSFLHPVHGEAVSIACPALFSFNTPDGK